MKPAPPVTSTRSPIRRRLRVRRARSPRPRRARRRRRLAGCGGGAAARARPAPRRRARRIAAAPRRARRAHARRSAANPRGSPGTRRRSCSRSGCATRRARLRRPARPSGRAPGPAAGAAAPPRLRPRRGRRSWSPPSRRTKLLVVSPGRRIVTATKVGTHPHDATVGRRQRLRRRRALRPGLGAAQTATSSRPCRPRTSRAGSPPSAERWVALVAVSARVLQVYGVHSLKRARPAPGRGRAQPRRRRPALYAYVADTQGEQILVYRIGRHPRLVAEVAAPGTPYGLAIDPRRHRALGHRDRDATGSPSSRLAGRRPRRIATYPTVRQPNSVDSRRAHRRGLRRRARRRADRADRPRRGSGR